MTRKEKIEKIKIFVDHLPDIYPSLSFDNHCYRRMAYDVAIGGKWDTKVSSPFVHNVSEDMLDTVLDILDKCVANDNYLHNCNRISMKYRKKSNND